MTCSMLFLYFFTGFLLSTPKHRCTKLRFPPSWLRCQKKKKREPYSQQLDRATYIEIALLVYDGVCVVGLL